MKTLQKLFLFCALMISSACVFSACGDDDKDDTPMGDTTGAPYTGVWKVSYVNMVEDGDSYQGPADELTNVRLTLYQNGNFIFESAVYDDNDGPSMNRFTGTWSYAGKTLTLNSEEPYEGVTVFKVLTWTNEKLVTNQTDEGDSYTWIWTKTANVNI